MESSYASPDPKSVDKTHHIAQNLVIEVLTHSLNCHREWSTIDHGDAEKYEGFSYGGNKIGAKAGANPRG